LADNKQNTKVVDVPTVHEVYANQFIAAGFDGSSVTISLGTSRLMPEKMGDGIKEGAQPAVFVTARLAISAAAAVDAMHSPLQDDAGKVKAFWAEVLDKATAANLAWYQALCGTFLDDMSESLAALGVVKDGVPGKAYIDLGADRLALGVDFNGVRVDAELLSGSEFTRFAWAVATASQDRALVLGELETMADSTMEIAFRWLDSKPELRCVLATCHGDPAKPLRQRFPYVSDSWQIAEVGRLAA